MEDLAARMKANYEQRASHQFTRRMPVIVRVDGRAFHTYLRKAEKPFDLQFVAKMVYAAKEVASEMQGFKMGYVQSDEASFLLTDYDSLETDAWFDYKQSKIESISASIMTAAFNCPSRNFQPLAHFDARAFNIPEDEVANYFLWRMKDWERNSLSMYCRAHYSHREMAGKSRAEQHEMLHAKGLNWVNDLDDQLRNGTVLLRGTQERGHSAIRDYTDVRPRFAEVNEIATKAIHGFIMADSSQICPQRA